MVDKKLGIILSNRYVVNLVLMTSTVFRNYKEIPLHPIYDYPIHDFRSFKYDISNIKFADIVHICRLPWSLCSLDSPGLSRTDELTDDDGEDAKDVCRRYECKDFEDLVVVWVEIRGVGRPRRFSVHRVPRDKRMTNNG